MADLKKIDPKNPYGKVTKNTPAVVEKLNPKEGKLYEAMETSPDKIRKSKTYKLALWCPTMQEARRQAKEMNARTPFGRPKVSKDPNNPQSGAAYPLPQAEGPGAEVKQFIKQPKQDPKDALPDSPNKMPFKMTAKLKAMPRKSLRQEAELDVQFSDTFQEDVQRVMRETGMSEDDAFDEVCASDYYQGWVEEALEERKKEAVKARKKVSAKLMGSLYDASQGLTWDITPKALVLRLDEAGQAALREAIEENGGSVSNQMEWELLENLFSNSEMDTVRPEEVGALTDSILIGDVDRDDQGNITQVHNVYWDPNYAVRSFAQDLAEKGEASLPSGVEPATSSTDTKHFKVGDKVVSKIGEEGTVVEEEIGSKVGVEFEGDPQIQLVRVKDLKLKGRLTFKAEPLAVTLSFKKFENTQDKKDDAIELTIKPADEHVLALVTPGLDSMAGRFKDLGNGVYEVMATTVDEAKGYAKDGLAGSGLNVVDESGNVLVLEVPSPVVASLRLQASKVSDFAVGDTVIDRHGQSLEVAEIGNDKKRGPWLDLEYSDGDRNRYYDRPQGPTEAVKLDEDVKTLVKEDDYDPSQSYPGDYPAGRSAEASDDLEDGGPEGLKSFDFIASWKGVKAPSEDILRSIFSVDGEHAGAFWVGGEESDQEEHQNIGYRPFDVVIKKAGKGKFNVDVVFHDIRATDMAEAEALSEDWGLHVNVDYLIESGLDKQVQFPTTDGDTALADASKLVESKPVKASLGLRYFDPKSHRVKAMGAAPILRQLHRAFGAMKFKRNLDFVEVSAGAQFLGTWHPRTQAFNFDAAADDTVKKLDSLFLRAMQVKANSAVSMVLEALSQVGATDVVHEDQAEAVVFQGTLANGVNFEFSLNDETLTLNPSVEFSDPEDMMGPPFETSEVQDADLPVQLEDLMDLLKEMGGRVAEPVEARLKNLVAGLKIQGELLKVGDKVLVARSFGRGPVEEAVIASITLADERGGADGTEVKQMAWDLVPEWATVTFEAGGWAYGYQLTPVKAESEVQAAIKADLGPAQKAWSEFINTLPEDAVQWAIDNRTEGAEDFDDEDDPARIDVVNWESGGTMESLEAIEYAIENCPDEALVSKWKAWMDEQKKLMDAKDQEQFDEFNKNQVKAKRRAQARFKAMKAKLVANDFKVGQKVTTQEGPGETIDYDTLGYYARKPETKELAEEMMQHEPEVGINGFDPEELVFMVRLDDGDITLEHPSNLQAGRRPSRVFAKTAPKRSNKKEEPVDEGFKEKARKALAKHLDIPLEEMPEADGKGSHGFWDDELGEDRAVSWGALTQEAGGRDYVVYRDYESAEEAAKRSVKNDLESEPEIFNQDWLMGAIPHDAMQDHFESVVRESVEFNVDDMDEDDLKEEMERAGVDNRDDLIEKMIEQAGDPIDYVRDNFGDEEYQIQIKEVFRGLSGAQLDEIAQEAVDADGPGHFISGWDGDLDELEGGMYLAKW